MAVCLLGLVVRLGIFSQQSSENLEVQIAAAGRALGKLIGTPTPNSVVACGVEQVQPLPGETNRFPDFAIKCPNADGFDVSATVEQSYVIGDRLLRMAVDCKTDPAVVAGQFLSGEKNLADKVNVDVHRIVGRAGFERVETLLPPARASQNTEVPVGIGLRREAMRWCGPIPGFRSDYRPQYAPAIPPDGFVGTNPNDSSVTHAA